MGGIFDIISQGSKLTLAILCFLAVTVSPLAALGVEGNALETSNMDVNLSSELNSRDLLASATQAAQVSISAVVYKFDDPKLLPVLQDVLARGLPLQVLCDEKESKDKGSLIRQLAQAGAQIKVWPRKQGKLHAKFVICDDSRVLTGSWNWTKSAGHSNLELLIDLDDPKAVHRFTELFARLWESGKPLKAK